MSVPADLERDQISGDPLTDDNEDWADLPRLRAVLQLARQAGADWVNLDADSDGWLPGLPRFDW